MYRVGRWHPSMQIHCLPSSPPSITKLNWNCCSILKAVTMMMTINIFWNILLLQKFLESKLSNITFHICQMGEKHFRWVSPFPLWDVAKPVRKSNIHIFSFITVLLQYPQKQRWKLSFLDMFVKKENNWKKPQSHTSLTVKCNLYSPDWKIASIDFPRENVR